MVVTAHRALWPLQIQTGVCMKQCSGASFWGCPQCQAVPWAAQVTRRELKNLRTYKGSVNRLLERVSKLKQVMAPTGTRPLLDHLRRCMRAAIRHASVQVVFH